MIKELILCAILVFASIIVDVWELCMLHKLEFVYITIKLITRFAVIIALLLLPLENVYVRIIIFSLLTAIMSIINVIVGGR